jgi:hypothetical protein
VNIIDAIKSGRRFRSDPGSVWFDGMDSSGDLVWSDGPNQVGGRRPLRRAELLDDDWEIEEPTVTITRTQFYGACRIYAAGAGLLTKHHHDVESDPYWFRRVAEILGLEPMSKEKASQ